MFKLMPSSLYKAMMGLAHIVALAACFNNALPVLVKVMLGAAIIGHYAYTVRYAKVAQCRIQYTELSGWQIASSEDFEPIEILPSTVLTNFAIVLQTDKVISNTRKDFLILTDALNQNDYRRFLVKLKTSMINQH